MPGSKTSCLFTTIVFIASTGVGQNTSEAPATERLLLPVVVRNAPGAQGTIWTDDLVVILKSNVHDFAVPFVLDPSCDPPDPCSQLIGYGAGEPLRLRVVRTRAGQTPGSYFYVGADQLDDVSMHLMLRETTRGAPAIELPIVRDRDFSSAPRDFVDVPVLPNERATLRIYGDDPDKGGNVRVRLFSARDGSVISDKNYALSVTQLIYHDRGDWKLRPQVVQIDGLTDGIASPSIYVEVTPVTPRLRIWALLSLTDSATQQVTLRYGN